MKSLLEKRAKLLDELDVHLADETRSLPKEELDVVNAKIASVKEIDAQIEQQKEIRTLKNTKSEKKEDNNMELRTKLENGLTEVLEIRAEGNTTANTGGQVKSNGELVQMNVPANDLLAHIRQIPVVGGQAIPVQKAEMDELVPVAELAEMAKVTAEVGEVTLVPKPHGVIVPVSNTVIANSSFDFEGHVKTIAQSAINKTITKKAIEVINGATVGEVARETEGVLTYADVTALYLGLKQEYRADAVFVANDADLKALMGLVDLNGQPILVRDMTQAYGFTVFGRPVVQDNRATKLAFVNVNKAMAVGVGTEASVTKSIDALFTSNATAIRVIVDVACEKTIDDALVFLESAVA